MKHIEIRRPDDWHVHFRDSDLLRLTVPATAKDFARALVMPNLKPPLTTIDSLLAYKSRVLNAATAFDHFSPFFTLYLNEAVSPDTLVAASRDTSILGAKLYPAGSTTHSEQGAQTIKGLYPLFEVMQAHHLVLQIHGEMATGDVFEREEVFIQQELIPLQRAFPKLRIVLEHISTRAAVEYIQSAPSHIAATITPHHLLYNRNQMLAGGIRPHYYCLPILKSEQDRRALLDAVKSGHPKFFAGTDSAPHAKNQKECASGCAGIYSAPFALSMYAEIFETIGALPKLDAFLGMHGANFYQLPISEERVTLIREPVSVPKQFNFGEIAVVPVHAGGAFAWRVQ